MTVQRSISAVILLIAAVAFGTAAGSWWLQRTIFTPNPSPDIAEAVLSDSAIRLEIEAVVAARTADALETSPDQLAAFLEDQVLRTRGGAVELAAFIQRAHLRVIGANDDLIVMVPSELVRIVRDERAFDAPSATVPVPVIGTLSTARSAMRWIMLIAAGVGLLTLAVGLVLRPYRTDLVRALGETLIAIAVGVVVIGWALPTFVIPAIDTSTWTGLAPSLAGRSLPVVIGGSLVLVIAGLALIVTGINAGRRGGWNNSGPVRVYRDQRRWS